MELNNISIKRNDVKGRFELDVNQHIAFIEFEKLNDSTLNLCHTEVPIELEGKGVGKVLVIKTLEYCKENNIKIVATCPFISAFLLRHPEWQSITTKLSDEY